MDQIKSFAPVLARLFLTAMFLPHGVSLLGDVPGFTQYMTSGGVPAIFAWPAILFEIALGLSMLLGFQARLMALLGAGFCIATATLYHLDPADDWAMILFYKDLGVSGAFLMIFAHGPGRLALDRS